MGTDASWQGFSESDVGEKPQLTARAALTGPGPRGLQALTCGWTVTKLP